MNKTPLSTFRLWIFLKSTPLWGSLTTLTTHGILLAISFHLQAWRWNGYRLFICIINRWMNKWMEWEMFSNPPQSSQNDMFGHIILFLKNHPKTSLPLHLEEETHSFSWPSSDAAPLSSHPSPWFPPVQPLWLPFCSERVPSSSHPRALAHAVPSTHTPLPDPLFRQLPHALLPPKPFYSQHASPTNTAHYWPWSRFF